MEFRGWANHFDDERSFAHRVTRFSVSSVIPARICSFDVSASAWTAFGRDAAFYLNPLLASLTVLAVFLFTRRWAGPLPAIGAAVVQAVQPEANSHALNSTSHTATTFFLTELTTSNGLDVMDGTEEPLFTEVLEQKRT